MTAEQRERIEQIYIEMYDQLMTVGRSSLKSEALAEEAIHAALWDYANKHGIVIEGLEKPVSDISEHEEEIEEEY